MLDNNLVHVGYLLFKGCRLIVAAFKRNVRLNIFWHVRIVQL